VAGKAGEYIDGSEPGAWDNLPEAFNVMLASRTVQALARLIAEPVGPAT